MEKKEIILRTAYELITPVNKTLVVDVELRLISTSSICKDLQPFFVAYHKTETAQTGDFVIDNVRGEVIIITEEHSQSFINRCSRILVMTHEIPRPILNHIETGEMLGNNKATIEVELEIKKATKKSDEDEIFHKVKYDTSGKVNFISYERFIKGTIKTSINTEQKMYTLEDMKKAYTKGGADKYYEFDNFIKAVNPVEFKPFLQNQAAGRSERNIPHLISIKTSNSEGCWVTDGQGDPARTTVKKDAKIYSSWHKAATRMIQLKKMYPNREYSLEEVK